MKNKKQQQNKLLKIKFIKTKVYKKNNFSGKLKIKHLKFTIKKVFSIIYKYHVNNKKITFVCNDLTINLLKNNQLLKNTKHKFIHKQFCFKNFLILKQTNLIIICDKTVNLNFSFIKKIYEIKIPVIFLFKMSFKNNCEYEIPGNFIFFKNMKNNFLLNLLKIIFK